MNTTNANLDVNQDPEKLKKFYKKYNVEHIMALIEKVISTPDMVMLDLKLLEIDVNLEPGEIPFSNSEKNAEGHSITAPEWLMGWAQKFLILEPGDRKKVDKVAKFIVCHLENIDLAKYTTYSEDSKQKGTAVH